MTIPYYYYILGLELLLAVAITFIEKNVTGITLNYALFYDDKGEWIGKTKMPMFKKQFEYKKEPYLTDKSNISSFRIQTFLANKDYYTYRLHNPNPIQMSKSYNSIIDSEHLKALLESDALIKLNTPPSKLADWLNWKTAVIGVAVLGGLYWFSTHGGLGK